MMRFTSKALKVTCATALTIGLAGAGASAFAATGADPMGAATIQAAEEAVGPISFSPASGGVAASTIVTLEGEGIENATEVRFGVRPATILPDAPEGQLRVQVPTAVEVEYQAKWVPVTVTIDGLSYRIGEYAYVVESAVDKQMAYALKHWEKYNSEQYGDFSPSDCMNFVSQTLAARGVAMDEEWHNNFGPGDSPDNWQSWTTPAWISVSNFERYLETKQEALGVEKLDLWAVDRSKLALGDIVVFEWVKRAVTAEQPADMPDDLWQLLAEDGDHAMVITDLVHNADGTISVKLAGHTNDRDFLDLDYVLDNIDIADGNFWHFPEY